MRSRDIILAKIAPHMHTNASTYTGMSAFTLIIYDADIVILNLTRIHTLRRLQ